MHKQKQKQKQMSVFLCIIRVTFCCEAVTCRTSGHTSSPRSWSKWHDDEEFFFRPFDIAGILDGIWAILYGRLKESCWLWWDGSITFQVHQIFILDSPLHCTLDWNTQIFYIYYSSDQASRTVFKQQVWCWVPNMYTQISFCIKIATHAISECREVNKINQTLLLTISFRTKNKFIVNWPMFDNIIEHTFMFKHELSSLITYLIKVIEFKPTWTQTTIIEQYLLMLSNIFYCLNSSSKHMKPKIGTSNLKQQDLWFLKNQIKSI